MMRITLATGLLVREINRQRHVLLTASTYANHASPLWNLPGGRQEPGELLQETVSREFLEETGLRVGVDTLAYVSESYDGDTHVLNVTFRVCAVDDVQPVCRGSGDHVVAAQWVPLEDLAARMSVEVVRDPLLAYLDGTLTQRYAGFHRAGITIVWPDAAG